MNLRALWRQMVRIRRMEEALMKEYPAGEMRCPMHFCIGQEAMPAALSLLVEQDDYLFSHHRSHGYYLAKGAPMRELFAEVYGRATGANGGIAGSQDISHEASHFYSGAILAGGMALATGAAFAFQYRKTKQIAIAAFGEGATEEGAFWEAVNYAAVRRLPILFICENNKYATYSPQMKRQLKYNITERVEPFGVRSERIFGNDADLAYRTLKRTMAHIRDGDGPAFIEADTYRWNSHVGPEDDNFNGYRAKGELEFWRENCPIKRLAPSVESSLLPYQTEAEIAEEIAESFRFAKESPFPDASSIHTLNPSSSHSLGDMARSDFNHNQPEAKLEPY